MLTELVIGGRYTNDQIRFALQVENLGGIRPSVDSNKNLRHLVIMTTAQSYGKIISDNPYNDRIENGILTYTAQGRTGNQQITGRNKRIPEQYANPIPFYCFSNEGKQSYTFLGLLELLRHYEEMQVDAKRELRRVWVFEFRIHNEIPVVPIKDAQQIATMIFANSKRIPVEEREIILPEMAQSSDNAGNYEIEGRD